MAKKIVWTQTAVRQRHLILEYWLQRNKSNAYPLKLIDKIAEKTKLISKNPLSGKLINYPDARLSAMGHYSIIYKIAEDKIIIMAFWDNRQDPMKLLKIIKSAE